MRITYARTHVLYYAGYFRITQAYWDGGTLSPTHYLCVFQRPQPLRVAEKCGRLGAGENQPPFLPTPEGGGFRAAIR